MQLNTSEILKILMWRDMRDKKKNGNNNYITYYSLAPKLNITRQRFSIKMLNNDFNTDEFNKIANELGYEFKGSLLKKRRSTDK